MPSTTSSSVSRALGLFNRDHALVADPAASPWRSSRRFPSRRWRRWCQPARFPSDVETFLERFFTSSTTGFHRRVDAALQVHRVQAGRNGLGAFTDDRLREHGRGRGAVPGEVIGLMKPTSRSICAPMFLELVGELDLLGDGDAVLGDAGRAERLVDDDVAALRTRASPSPHWRGCRRRGACAHGHRRKNERL